MIELAYIYSATRGATVLQTPKDFSTMNSTVTHPTEIIWGLILSALFFRYADWTCDQLCDHLGATRNSPATEIQKIHTLMVLFENQIAKKKISLWVTCLRWISVDKSEDKQCDQSSVLLKIKAKARFGRSIEQLNT